MHRVFSGEPLTSTVEGIGPNAMMPLWYHTVCREYGLFNGHYKQVIKIQRLRYSHCPIIIPTQSPLQDGIGRLPWRRRL